MATQLEPLSEPRDGHRTQQSNSHKMICWSCLRHNAESSSYLPDSFCNPVTQPTFIFFCQTPPTNSNPVYSCLATKLLNTWAASPANSSDGQVLHLFFNYTFVDRLQRWRENPLRLSGWVRVRQTHQSMWCVFYSVSKWLATPGFQLSLKCKMHWNDGMNPFIWRAPA